MTLTIHNTAVSVVRGSVIDQDVEAIVNAANTMMRGGGAVDGAIHRQAGKGMVQELEELVPNRAKTGQVVITGGHNLKQQFVFHVAGPRWRDGNHGEPDLLTMCYRGSMEAADQNGIASIGFCSISTGVYGYPTALAAPLAVRTIIDYLKTHPSTTLTRVIFAMFGDVEYVHFETALENATKTP